jgi:iron-sulfur cluster repair protein YtfE (RIC family)
MSFVPAGPEIAGLADQTIRDLVAAHPETMAILAPFGIDLCCGGGRRLGEALELHGLDRDSVLRQIAPVVGVPTGKDG